MECLGLLLVAGRKEGGVEKDAAGAGEEVGKGERKERDEGKKDRVEGGNRERSVRERM